MATSDFEKEIGVRIAGILENEYPDISKQEIAQLIGVAPPNLSDMFSGKRRFHVDMLCKIANRLGCTVDYLIGNSDCASVEKDMQIACATTGLSQKAVENIAKNISSIQNIHHAFGYRNINPMNTFFESDHCRLFFHGWDEVSVQADHYYDYVREDPYRHDSLDQSAMLQLMVFRLMKTVESAAAEIYDPLKIAVKAEFDYMAEHKNEASLNGQTD